jgi:large subunit ribosomal protein L25
MAGEIPDLQAVVRTGTGKGAARQARRDGHVPGIIYGGGKDPQPISIDFYHLLKRLKAGRFKQTLFNVKVEGGQDERVICRAVQRDVVKDLPTHVDFMRLSPTSRINLFIHVTFENHDKAPGIKRGGALTIVRPEVELEVNASDIPDHITVDLTGRDINDVIHINDVALPAGCVPTIKRNFVIANITPPSGFASTEDEDETAPAA